MTADVVSGIDGTRLLSSTSSAGFSGRDMPTWPNVLVDWRALRCRVDALARSFDGLQGQRIVVVAANGSPVVTGLFAVWRVGAAAVSLNGRARLHELACLSADVGPRAVGGVAKSTDSAMAEVVAQLASSEPSTARPPTLDPLGKVTGDDRRPFGSQSPRQPEAATTILFTSGTTVDPNGVIEAHRSGSRSPIRSRRFRVRMPMRRADTSSR